MGDENEGEESEMRKSALESAPPGSAAAALAAAPSDGAQRIAGIAAVEISGR